MTERDSSIFPRPTDQIARDLRRTVVDVALARNKYERDNIEFESMRAVEGEAHRKRVQLIAEALLAKNQGETMLDMEVQKAKPDAQYGFRVGVLINNPAGPKTGREQILLPMDEILGTGFFQNADHILSITGIEERPIPATSNTNLGK